jgi:hypothetical protein
MTKQKLDINALEISSFSPQPQAAPVPVQAMTGASGYCNTCDPVGCQWTV